MRLSATRHDRLALFPNRRDRHRKKDREGDDLENVAARHGVDHARGENVGDDFEQRLGMSLRNGIDDFVRSGNQLDAHARLGQVDDCESDRERRGGGDLEIDDRLQTPSGRPFSNCPHRRFQPRWSRKPAVR